MLTNYQLLKKASETYLEKQRNNSAKLARVEYILENDPEYILALNKVNTTRFEISKCKYEGLNSDKLCNQLTAERKLLDQIIEKNKITKADLEINYTCKDCKDTGYIENKRCHCHNKLINELALKELGMYGHKLYSFLEIDMGHLNNLDKYKNALINYCNKFPNFTSQSSIVLSGKTGTGKTFLSKCVANELLKKQFSVIFITAFELNNILLKYHTAEVSEKSLYLEILTTCDLLLIDDLGSEPIYKNVTIEYLLLCIDIRLSNGLPFIVTTNLNQDDILKRYGDRIFSRLNDKKTIAYFNLTGEDLRIKKG